MSTPAKVGPSDLGGRIARVLVLDADTDAALGALLYELRANKSALDGLSLGPNQREVIDTLWEKIYS